jgi:hypothetical protein
MPQIWHLIGIMAPVVRPDTGSGLDTDGGLDTDSGRTSSMGGRGQPVVGERTDTQAAALALV